MNEHQQKHQKPQYGRSELKMIIMMYLRQEIVCEDVIPLLYIPVYKAKRLALECQRGLR